MPNPALSLEQEERDGIFLIRVSGPLDSMTHDQFKDYLDPLAATPRARIILDCEKLSYVNSRGITLLARYQRSLSSNLAFFGITGLNSRIEKSIELLGMSKLLRVYPTLDEALKAAAVL